MITEKLYEAIQLIKAGNKQAAIPLLKDVLQTNPKDENAWLWMYTCVSKLEEKKFCLQKALEINPENQQARKALEKLNASMLAPNTPEQTSPVSTPTAPAPQTPPQQNRSGWVLAFGLIMILLCVSALGIYFLLQGRNMAALAADIPLWPRTATFTPSITPTRTITSTPTPSATRTMTPTRRPSATLIPELASPTLPLTAAPFTPGNPTAVQPGSDIADPNFQKAVDAYLLEDFDITIELLTTFIKDNPDSAPAYRYRSAAYSKSGDCVAGMDDSKKAIDLDPNYAGAWESHGLANSCLVHEPETIMDLQKALSLDGSLATSHHSLGLAYFRLENYKKALEEYEIAIAIDPTRSKTWAGKSRSLSRLGQYRECIESADQALELKPVDVLAYKTRASCKLNLGQITESIEDYSAFLNNVKLSKTRIPTAEIGSAHQQRAYLYSIEQKFEQAIPDYKAAIELLGEDARRYCDLSYAYFGAKQYQNVIDAGKKSRAINPACGGERLLGVMARSAYGLGDYQQALGYIEQAVSTRAPVVNHYYRGLIMEALHRNAEAIQSFEHFIAKAYGGPDVEDARARLARLQP